MLSYMKHEPIGVATPIPGPQIHQWLKKMAEFDVQQWLRILGFKQYGFLFRSNGYRSFEDLLGLTEDGLSRLFVWYSSDRYRLLSAVEKLKRQGREAATRALSQDLLVSVYTEIKYSILLLSALARGN